MGWTHFAMGGFFLHKKSLSMIVLEVYVDGIPARKGKCQSPILIYLHGPGTHAISPQLMKIEMGQGHILQSICGVDYVQPITQATGEFWRNSSLAISLEELAQALMLE
jgi:hypothetical protein